MSTVTDALQDLGLPFPNARDILFLTGAGISVPDPTAFPLGPELYQIVLDNFASLSSDDSSRALSAIPFERSCEIVGNVFRTHPSHEFANVFWELVSELFIWRPNEPWKQSNDLHRFFGEHVRRGGTHITANLDQFIERDDLSHLVRTTKTIEDGARIDPNDGVLYKFHGDCNIDFVGEQGFVLSAIGNGFSSEVRGAWDALLNRGTLIVVCGYGALDRFDVTPYFSSKASSAFSRGILWVDYADAPAIKSGSAPSADIDMILSKFSRSVILKGRAGDVLNGLAPDLPRIHTMTRTGFFKIECRTMFANTVAAYTSRFTDFQRFRQTAGAAIAALLPRTP